MFQVTTESKVYGPFSSRAVAREFARMMSISEGKDVTNYQVSAV